MTTEMFVKAQLAILCWRNAPEKRLEVLKALAFVQRNRVRAGWHGGDWLAIIADDPLYAYNVKAGIKKIQDNGSPTYMVTPNGEEWPDLRDETFQRFLWEVDRIYDGSAGDVLTEGALFWAVAGEPMRPWFQEKISSQPGEHPRVAQVAQVMLWR